MQPCEQSDNIKHISERVDTLCDYTGMNPMANGKSLRGQIESLRDLFRKSTNRQNLLFVVVATVIVVLMAVSTWATRNDAKTVMDVAKQISLAAESIQAAQPLTK
jgi:hypothetical protein